MNDVDRMRIELEALRKDVRRLEVLFQTKAALNDDEREAQHMAELMGFPVEIMMLPIGHKGQAANSVKDKLRRVARELRCKRSWPASRIARALHLSERTTQRFIA